MEIQGIRSDRQSAWKTMDGSSWHYTGGSDQDHPPKKDVLFIIGDWNAKVGSQRNTLSNRQIWPWNAEWSRAKANRVLSRKHTGHSKHPLQQHRRRLHMDIIRWSTLKSDWLYSLQPKMEKLYTVSKNKPGADCGSDHELLITKFRLKLKKVRKPLDYSGMT